MLWFGWIFAAICGCVIPMFLVFMGPVFDSFGAGQDRTESREQVRLFVLIIVGLGVLILVASYIRDALLRSAAEKIVAKFKERYVRAIIAQESAWFDQINITELNSRVARECISIKAAIGDKLGMIIYGLAMCVAGLSIGVWRGWSLALAMLAIGPMIGLGFSCLMTVV